MDVKENKINTIKENQNKDKKKNYASISKLSLGSIAAISLAACGGGGGGGGGGLPIIPVSPSNPNNTGEPESTNNPPAEAGAENPVINHVNPPAPPITNPNSPGSPDTGVPNVPSLPGEGVVPVGAATTIYTKANNAMEASRFLHQATPGATKEEIVALQAITYSDWIEAQFNMPRSMSHTDWLMAKGYGTAQYSGHLDGFDNTIWRKFIQSPDGLRQRMVLALSELLVVAIDGLNQYYPMFSVGNYFDILETHAFGNYRDLLQDISTSTAMGAYLTFSGNQLSNGQSQPDENYAREIMQLFTIGLYKLNNDGSLVMNGSTPVPTYTQEDVSGLARVFTGWYPDESQGSNTPLAFIKPMTVLSGNYEPGVKKFLGTTIPAGSQSSQDARKSLSTALDVLFNHPNVPPFIGKQLIQRLITSNPSSAYVNRVSQAFINNGSGVRGDMKAVLRAILLDDEARNVSFSNNGAYGKLREPVMRFLNWARAFKLSSIDTNWNGIGNLSSAAFSLGQSPGHSPSVFNFFRPGYIPSTSALGKYNLTAPEIQITNESSVSGYVNFMQSVLSGISGYSVDYAALITLSQDAAALLNELNLILAAQLSTATLSNIKQAVESIDSSTTAGKTNRVKAALMLIMATPEYLAQK